MTNLEDQGIRFERLLEALNSNQSELARKIGVSPSLINQIVKGQKALSHKVLTQLTNSYREINANWLLTGEGEMFMEKKEPESRVQTGVLEPDAEYVKGDGRLEWLERRVGELEVAVADLRRWREEMEEG